MIWRIRQWKRMDWKTMWFFHAPREVPILDYPRLCHRLMVAHSYAAYATAKSSNKASGMRADSGGYPARHWQSFLASLSVVWFSQRRTRGGSGYERISFFIIWELNANSLLILVTSSFLLLVVRPLLLETMHLFLVAYNADWLLFKF